MKNFSLFDHPFFNGSLVEAALFPNVREQSPERSFAPACDIDETETHFLVNLDIPGVSKEDIHIEVKDQELVVSGERKIERSKEQWQLSERVSGKFSRKFKLGRQINLDGIEARYQDGVLSLALPKTEEEKARVIKVLDKSN